MARKNTGFVAAKIRANTARKNSAYSKRGRKRISAVPYREQPVTPPPGLQEAQRILSEWGLEDEGTDLYWEFRSQGESDRMAAYYAADALNRGYEMSLWGG